MNIMPAVADDGQISIIIQFWLHLKNSEWCEVRVHWRCHAQSGEILLGIPSSFGNILFTYMYNKATPYLLKMIFTYIHKEKNIII